MVNSRCKFRAWDGEKILALRALFQRTETPENIYGDANLGCSCCWCPDVYGTDGLVFMQYTGLEDKNGEEIYEGDIVRLTETYSDGSGPKTNGGNSYAVGWIEFNDCCVSGQTWGLVDYGRFEPTLWDHQGEVEVVGNIYENPELNLGFLENPVK